MFTRWWCLNLRFGKSAKSAGEPRMSNLATKVIIGAGLLITLSMPPSIPAFADVGGGGGAEPPPSPPPSSDRSATAAKKKQNKKSEQEFIQGYRTAWLTIY